MGQVGLHASDGNVPCNPTLLGMLAILLQLSRGCSGSQRCRWERSLFSSADTGSRRSRGQFWQNTMRGAGSFMLSSRLASEE